MDKVKRFKSLDFLRAISLIMISCYHWFYFKGTYIGVIVFFALSGYLITNSLLTKEFSIWGELKKRVVKIYPSLLMVILISSVFLYYFNGGFEEKYRLSMIFSVLSLNNIYQIIYKISYFDGYNTLLPLTHIWALSLQMQVYILLPVMIKGFKKLKLSDNIISVIFTVLSIISAIIMGYKLYLGRDFSEIYYGTDTRIFTFFISAAVAAYYANKKKLEDEQKATILIISVITYIFLIFYALFFDYQSSFNYYGGLFLLSLGVSFIPALAIKVNIKKVRIPIISRIYDVIAEFGSREYQYYLWQYPIMIMMREIFKWSEMDFYLKFLIEILILVAVSEIFYQIFKRRERLMRKVSLIMLALIAILAYSVPNYENKDLEELNKIREEISEKTKEIENKEKEEVKTTEETTKESNENSQEKNMDKITFVGDSVMEMAKIEIQNTYPNAEVNSKVSRQFSELPKILMAMDKQGKLYNTVVIGLGTNGTISQKDMDRSLEILGDRKVYFINSVVPQSWEKSVNNFLDTIASENSNVKVIDWYKVAKGNKAIFYKDGTHPKIDGVKKYVKLISDNLK